MKNKKIIITLITFMLILCCVGIAYAMFYKSEEVENTFVFGDSKISSNIMYDTQSFAFKNAGDSKVLTLSIKNEGQSFLRYYFGIEVLQSSGLEKSLMLYFDNQFLGMASTLMSDSQEYIIQTNDYIYLDETRRHELKIELHIGSENFKQNKNLTLKINYYGVTPNVDEVTFVSSEEELIQAIYTANNNLNVSREIKLAKDIVLTKDLKVDGNAVIDLYGKTLDLNNANITITKGKTILKSTRETAQTQITGTGKIVLNGESVGFFINNAKIDFDKIQKNLYDRQTTSQIIVEKISKVLQNGLNAGEIDLFGYDMLYHELFESITDEISAVNQGILTVPNLAVSKISKLRITTFFGSNDIEYKVKGSGQESVVDEIVEHHLIYLSQLTQAISNDVFLPNRLKGYNCHIVWWSSAPDIISAEGRYNPAVDDTKVTLIAFFKINEQVFNRSFVLDVLGQTNEARMRYFLTRYNEILFTSQNETVQLPVVNTESEHDYRHYLNAKNLNFLNLTYDIDTQYSFLTLSGNNLTLNSITFVKYAQVKVTAEFDPSTGTQFVSGMIGVKIELGNTVYINEVFAYVQSQFQIKGNVLNNFKTENKGDFSMPKEYLSLGIKYKIDNTNIAAGQEPVTIIENQHNQSQFTFTVNTDNLKTYEFYIYVNVEVLTVTRKMEFLVPAVIHNDKEGFESADVFNRIKNQLGIAEQNQTYILIDTIINFTDELDLSGLSLNESVAGLVYFSNITALNVSGSQQFPSCQTPTKATELSMTIARLTKLERLNIGYSNLANLNYINLLVNLKNLNLKGNSGLFIFDDIIRFASLNELNISNTGYNAAYSQTILEFSYLKYYQAYQTAPKYYYTLSQNPSSELLFAPVNTGSDYLAGLNYLYNLSQIPEIKVQYTQLVTSVIINSAGDELPITWHNFNLSNLLVINTTLNNNTNTRIERLSKPQNDAVEVLSATITVNGTSVTRCFYVVIKGN